MINNEPISGVLNIDKPPSITSHNVVAQVRRILKARDKKIKVGHTGTLDPFATGVLLVALGSATRLIEYSHHQDKEYETVITLGATSDTDDVTGKILETDMKGLDEPKLNEIENILKQFVGTIKQVPPAYSAIKIKGERSYKLARQGSNHSLPTKQVTVHSLVLKKYEYPHLTLLVTCSTGTYIRSLARDIGANLGVGAFVKQLNRTRIGPHKIDNSVKLDSLTEDNIFKHLLPTTELISHLPMISLSNDNVAQFFMGKEIGNIEITKQYDELRYKHPELSSEGESVLLAVLSGSSTLLGVGHFNPTTGLLHPKTVLPPTT